MSRIGTVVKRMYGKELEALSNDSSNLGLTVLKKLDLRRWKEYVTLDTRRVIIASTSSVLLLVLVFSSIIHYNRFKEVYTVVCARKADLDKEVRRKANLLPNINRLAEKYSGYEEKMFAYVASSRDLFSAAKLAEPTNVAPVSALEKPLTGLLALAEQYPNLKSMQSIDVVIDEWTESENRVADAKERFNAAAEEFNQMRTVFPANLFGKVFGLKTIDYIGLDGTWEPGTVSRE